MLCHSCSAAYPGDDATLFKILEVVEISLVGAPGFTCEFHSEMETVSIVANANFQQAKLTTDSDSDPKSECFLSKYPKFLQ